jgi:xylulokinase
VCAENGFLLAIDVGTTTTRCILFDLEGRPVGEAYREPRAHHPRPNWTEVDPEDWWTSAAAVIREALQRSGVSSESILGIGLSGLMHALVPIDKRGRPLARTMLWMDQRCQPQAEWLTREHGELVRELTGRKGPVGTTLSAPKLRWIVENEPELLRRTHKFLPVKDFVRLRLTGTWATDPSDAAGTCLFDQRSSDWSIRMLECIGVPPEKMPPIRSGTEVIGTVTEGAAQATGLPPGTPVVVGGADVPCTRIGANARVPGRACLYLGTAAWISVSRPGKGRDAIGATATTGASLKWLLALLGIEGSTREHGSRYASLVDKARTAPPGARGVIFLPHLMGERGPHHNPEAKGVLFGLTLAHGQPEIARAVLEGCAFQLRAILESPNLGDVRDMVAVGGGARSALWLDIIADVTDVTLTVPRVLEAGALGAAILAGVGVGVYRDVHHAAEQLVQIVARHEPDGARRELYDRIYALFLELEKNVTSLYGKVPIELEVDK